jgi:hypothetical protein
MSGFGAAVLTRGAWLKRTAPLLRNLGPYAAIELLMPGGSLIALALWLYQRRRKAPIPISTRNTATAER